VAIDIFSRYVPGWMVASAETAELAEGFIAKAVTGQGIERGRGGLRRPGTYHPAARG